MISDVEPRTWSLGLDIFGIEPRTLSLEDGSRVTDVRLGVSRVPGDTL